jgi:hypothetical protein
MMTRRIGKVFHVAFVGASVLVLAVVAFSQGDPKNSEQVVFSGVGTLKEGGTPFGFWVWCEAESDNPYAGNCAGAAYLYAQKLTKGVVGTITENEDDGSYTMTLTARDASIVFTLTNVAPEQRGPKNTVNAFFSVPNVGEGQSTNAVVNVTGPKE